METAVGEMPKTQSPTGEGKEGLGDSWSFGGGCSHNGENPWRMGTDQFLLAMYLMPSCDVLLPIHPVQDKERTPGGLGQ